MKNTISSVWKVSEEQKHKQIKQKQKKAGELITGKLTASQNSSRV